MLALVLVLVAGAFAGALADTVYLRDGTVLKGRVLWMRADSLAVRTGFGATLRIARTHVARVVVGDSPGAAAQAAPEPRAAGRGAAVSPGDSSRLVITFKDRELSSRIDVDRGRDRAAKLAAVRAIQLVLVDGDTAWARIDSTIDKVVYRGPVRGYRNTIRLKDVDVRVPAGRHQVSLVVRNLGSTEWADAFEPRPIDLEIGLGEIDFRPGAAARFHVGIRRGKLRLGRPELYVVERGD